MRRSREPRVGLCLRMGRVGRVSLVGAVGLIASCTLDAPLGTVPGTASLDGGLDGQGTTGPTVAIHVRASATPPAPNDGLSGETPRNHGLAIRSLTLLRDANDTAGATIFDLGGAPVDCSLDDGADTVVTRVPVASLAAGHYARARIGVSYARWTVDATYHDASLPGPVAGAVEEVVALAGGVTIDGSARNQGWYKVAFLFGSQRLGERTGEGAALPDATESSPFSLEKTADSFAYAFDIDVTVDPSVGRDVSLIFDVNTFEDFRWQDESKAGYASQVFDLEATSYEPVKSFAATAFHVTLE